jgi:hypothetical protein
MSKGQHLACAINRGPSASFRVVRKGEFTVRDRIARFYFYRRAGFTVQIAPNHVLRIYRPDFELPRIVRRNWKMSR